MSYLFKNSMNASGHLAARSARPSNFKPSYCATLLAGASLFAFALSAPALAQTTDEEDNQPAIAQAAQIRSFNIPAGDLQTGLTALSARINLQLIYPADLTIGRHSQGVQGDYTDQEALEQLLSGTGLSYRLEGTDTAILENPATKTEAPATLDPIVVTARRIEESDIKVPVTTLVFDSANIEKSNLTRFEDLADFTPGLSYSNTGRRTRNDVFIRGIGNFIGEAATAGSIGISVDGVAASPSGSQLGINQAFFDLERIEVLYGPQGTTFGKNSLGGLINYVTKKPTADTEFDISGTADSFKTKSIKTTLNGSLTGDEDLTGRLTLFASESDGFIEYADPGLGDFEYRDTGARLALRSKAFENTVYDLSATYFRSTDNGAEIISAANFEEAKRNGSDFRSDSNTDEDNTTESFNLIQSVDHDLGWANIISNTGFVRIQNDEFGDRDLTATDILSEVSEQELNSFSQEFRLEAREREWSLPGTVAWTAGAITSYDTSELSQTLIGGTSFPLPGATILTRSDSDVLHLAGFGEVRYRPVPAFELGLGGRYTIDRVKTEGENTPSSPALGVTTVDPFSFSETFDAFTPKLTALYEFSDDLSVYGSVAQGYKSGGVDRNGDSFDEESLLSYEIGTKGLFLDNKLRTNLALFYNDWDDLQLSLSRGLLNTSIENAGSARSFGATVGVSYQVLPELNIGLNYGYTNSEIESFEADRSIEGRDIPITPKHSFGSTLDLAIPVTYDIDWTFRAEYTIQSSFFDSAVSSQADEIDGYNILNLRSGLDTDFGTFELFAENLLDEIYITNAREANGTIFRPASVTPGERRRVGVRFTASF